MPIIVIEGPDESGKTTLAKNLKRSFMGAFGPHQVEMQRSPVKEHGWSDEYNTYLNNLLRLNDSDHIIIQDRIPEISESIYGMIRGESRNVGWLHEIGPWLQSNVCLVFCVGPYQFDNGHKDAEGLTIYHESLAQLNILYEYTYDQIEGLMSEMGFGTEFRVIQYNRWLDDQSVFAFEIVQWLSQFFPDKRKVLKKVMDRLSEVKDV